MATTTMAATVEVQQQHLRPWLALYGVRLRPRPKELSAEEEVSLKEGLIL